MRSSRLACSPQLLRQVFRRRRSAQSPGRDSIERRCCRPVLPVVARGDDAADDAKGDRGLAVEAEPTSRLRRPGPRCGPPGGPRHQRLVGATGMARRDTPGELGRRCSGTGATAGQAQGGARQEGAGCLEARSGFGQLMERLVNQKLTRKRIIATSQRDSEIRHQKVARRAFTGLGNSQSPRTPLGRSGLKGFATR